jgi:hypothetical protein
LALLGVLAVTFLLSFAISKVGAAQRRSAAPWLCGYACEAEANRYIAHNFYGEIKRYFGGGVRRLSGGHGFSRAAERPKY